MAKLPRLLPPVIGAALAGLSLVGCAGSGTTASTSASVKPPERITVTARKASLVVEGVESTRAGFARIVVRNDSAGSHGIELVRLKHPLTTPQLLQAFAEEKHELLESLGGIQAVEPTRPWEMTVRLVPGAYALVDFGQDGPEPNYARGFYKRFQVSARSAGGAPPPTVGEIAMDDFRFDIRLPKRFSGHGTVRIPNRGRTSHEITLIRIEPGHTQQEVLNLILAGATEPPAWASIVEVLGVLDPGNTAYVKTDLRPGRYVALCLIDEPGSQKLHAQLGMVDTFDVR